ncbi:MAG TPA: polymer-forming cytoskeletal protein [Xanthomonadales bacterium]|nr:polymer-forming cytoskeletal protein [Xanthomonadales bacterium]
MFDKLKNTQTVDRATDRAMDRAAETKAAEPSMAASPSPMSQPAGKAAVIGAGIKINGEISGSENLLIEGQVDGKVNLSGNDVTIGKSGQVIADVSAKTIRVAGEVSGDLTAKERVVISGTGNVRGNVVAPRVVLEDGAIFKGSIDMDPGEAAVSSLAAGKSASKSNGAAATMGSSQAPASASPLASSTTEPARKAPDLSLKGG